MFSLSSYLKSRLRAVLSKSIERAKCRLASKQAPRERRVQPFANCSTDHKRNCYQFRYSCISVNIPSYVF